MLLVSVYCYVSLFGEGGCHRVGAALATGEEGGYNWTSGWLYGEKGEGRGMLQCKV